MGRLDCRLVSGRGLPKADYYCIVSTTGNASASHKSSTENNTANPAWNEVFKLLIADEHSEQVHIKVYDECMLGDKFVGEVKMGLSGLTRGAVEDKWVLLQQCSTNGSEIHVRLLAHDFGAAPSTAASPTQQQQPQQQQQQQQPHSPYANPYASPTNPPPPAAPSNFGGGGGGNIPVAPPPPVQQPPPPPTDPYANPHAASPTSPPSHFGGGGGGGNPPAAPPVMPNANPYANPHAMPSNPAPPPPSAPSAPGNNNPYQNPYSGGGGGGGGCIAPPVQPPPPPPPPAATGGYGGGVAVGGGGGAAAALGPAHLRIDNEVQPIALRPGAKCKKAYYRPIDAPDHGHGGFEYTLIVNLLIGKGVVNIADQSELVKHLGDPAPGQRKVFEVWWE